MHNLNQAVILCGGLGTRLRPITNSIPKPMVEIGSKPFLWHLMVKLSSQPNNIKRFLLLTGYLQEKIKAYFQDGKAFGWEITYSSGPTSWETGRRLWEAKEYIDHKFLLCYSDNFAQVSLPKIDEIMKKNNSSITLLITKKFKGNVKVKDSNNNILYSQNRKLEYGFVELGFMLCNKNDVIKKINGLKDKSNLDFSKVLEKLSIDNKISGYLINDNYHSIGDLSRLEKTRKYLKPKRILLIDRDGVINVKAARGKYISSWKDFEFVKDTITALQKLSYYGFKFIIITNQAGIATGDISERELIEIHKNMILFLNSKGIEILDIFASIDHWQSNSFRRKPNPGMFFEASEKFLLRLDQTFYIGDDPRDCEAAKNACCGSILIGDYFDRIDCFPDFSSLKLTDLVPTIINKFLENENLFNS